MACGQRCKEILDGGAAAQQSFECMRNTIVLGGEPDLDACAALLAAARAYAAACAAVVRSCGG